jgi:hypothetical protein
MRLRMCGRCWGCRVPLLGSGEGWLIGGSSEGARACVCIALGSQLGFGPGVIESERASPWKAIQSGSGLGLRHILCNIFPYLILIFVCSTFVLLDSEWSLVGFGLARLMRLLSLHNTPFFPSFVFVHYCNVEIGSRDSKRIQ